MPDHLEDSYNVAIQYLDLELEADPATVVFHILSLLSRAELSYDSILVASMLKHIVAHVKANGGLRGITQDDEVGEESGEENEYDLIKDLLVRQGETLPGLIRQYNDYPLISE